MGTHDGTDFEALYRACRDDVYAYVASLLRDASAAEDVTALAFERVLRGRQRFDPQRGNERAWLFGIARNAALDELAERRLVVRAALRELPPGDREVVLLKFIGRLSSSELARVIGTSETSATTRLSRALTRLREACGVTV